MKKIYSLLTLALFTVIISCTDDDLDPLNFTKVTKGRILALRGDALQSIYIDGNTFSSSFVPLIADGTEEFSYDAEYLSDDPASLESIDVYVEKESGERTLLKNIPASAFTANPENGRPMVHVSATLAEILPLINYIPVGSEQPIEFSSTFPLSHVEDGTNHDDVDSLLAHYSAGISIVTDINLTDGTQVLADDMVAVGLYLSDQFFPAMRIPFGIVKYCPYEAGDWSGTYKSIELIPDSDPVGPYTTTWTQTDDNVYEIGNVFNDPLNPMTLEITFAPSNSPYDQDVTITTKTLGAGDDAAEFSGKGSYDQCTGVISVSAVYGDTEFTYQFTKN